MSNETVACFILLLILAVSIAWLVSAIADRRSMARELARVLKITGGYIGEDGDVHFTSDKV